MEDDLRIRGCGRASRHGRFEVVEAEYTGSDQPLLVMRKLLDCLAGRKTEMNHVIVMKVAFDKE